MAKKASFEIYEGLDERKKKFVVVPRGAGDKKLVDEAASYLTKLNHCSRKHIKTAVGYVWKDELYLQNPAIPGARLVTVLTYIR